MKNPKASLKVMVVIGTRPEAIKMAPVIKRLEATRRVCTRVVTTGQHREMLHQVLRSFDVAPHCDLQIMRPNQTLARVAEAALRGLDDVLTREKPDVVLVQGDTSTSFIGSLAAFYHKIPVAHVEAGLRTWRRYDPFPEEINRRLIAQIADCHFAPTERARENLLAENIPPQDVYLVGNTSIDALRLKVRPDYTFHSQQLAQIPLTGARILLVTTHRRENLGAPMRHIFGALKRLAARYPDVHIVFPVHKNPSIRDLAQTMLAGQPRISVIEPLDYEDFVNLLARAHLVLTDSGGVQEEAPAVGKPVIILRRTTERPEAVEAGAGILAGTTEDEIIQHTALLLDDPAQYARMAQIRHPFGDGRASERIVNVLLERFGES